MGREPSSHVLFLTTTLKEWDKQIEEQDEQIEELTTKFPHQDEMLKE